MEHLKLTSAVLVGHSLGSCVALLAALKDLNRRTGLVSGLVLIWGLGPSGEIAVFCPVVGQAGHRMARDESDLGYLQDSNSSSRRLLRCCQGYSFVSRIICEISKNSWNWLCLYEDGERFVPSDMDAVRREFGKLQIPVLNILGKHDRVISRSTAEGLCKLLPRCSLMIVEGVGHAPHEEKPEEMVHLIREFMTNQPSPSGGG